MSHGRISLNELDNWMCKKGIARAYFCRLIAARTGVIIEPNEITANAYRYGLLSKPLSIAIKMLVDEIEEAGSVEGWVTTITKRQLKKTLLTAQK